MERLKVSWLERHWIEYQRRDFVFNPRARIHTLSRIYESLAVAVNQAARKAKGKSKKAKVRRSPSLTFAFYLLPFAFFSLLDYA